MGLNTTTSTMDLNPTFGAQELVEQLSHGSGDRKSGSHSASNASPRSYGGKSTGNKSSSNSSTISRGGDRQQQQQQSASSYNYNHAHVDEAYRRLGQRLSLLAHGDIIPREPPIVYNIQLTPGGSFVPFARHHFGGRSPKVAKTRYSDHGDHHERFKEGTTPGAGVRTGNNLLRKLTYGAKQTFRTWEQNMASNMNNRKKADTSSSTSFLYTDSKLSPQRFALSQLSIEAGGGAAYATDEMGSHGGAKTSGGSSVSSRGTSASLTSAGSGRDQVQPLANFVWSTTDRHRHRHRHHHSGDGGSDIIGKGLLSAVLEGHSDSNTSASGPAAAERSTHTSPSQSISTKGSNGVSSYGGNGNGNGNASSAHHSGAPASSIVARGKCLTVPPDPRSNDGCDNVDGNLIVYENDMIVVPRKSIHSLKPKLPRRASEFRVQSLLGQGTFAQVFKCLLVTTGEVVAVKIVKNKPAYTRQATIEIDVFRALTQGADESADGKQSTNSSVSSSQQQQQLGGTDDTTSKQPSPIAISSSSSTGSQGGNDGTNNMVNLICYFMHRSHLCLVFELLGLNLYEVLKQRHFRGLPLTVVRSIVIQSVEGIKGLSQKSIIHCDLKPENILLTSDDVVREVVSAGEGDGGANSGDPTQTASSATGSDEASRGDSLTTSGDNMSSGSSSNAQTIHMGNVVGTSSTTARPSQKRSVKLIDFGSACFEGYTAHTYIQSRFYRSPEVLVGLPYDSAIDMWSLGCVTAELFLGLPILPGVHEHDQLGRITEMIGKLPDWMLDQGSKATKYYIKYVARPSSGKSPDIASEGDSPLSASVSATPSPAPPGPQWRLKTIREYISSLSQNDIKKKGGLAKLEKQTGNRYFRRTRLPDILFLHAQSCAEKDRDIVPAFVHFLYGLLDPDPWKRWTAFQAVQHPFLTGSLHQLRRKTGNDKFDPKDTNHANLDLEYYWKPPWDPAICRRKLLNVQKIREKQQAVRRNLSARGLRGDGSRSWGGMSPGGGGVMVQQDRHQSGSSGGVVAETPPRQFSMSREQSVDSGVMPAPSADVEPISSSLASLDHAGRNAQLAMGTSPANSAINVLGQGSGRSFNSTGFVSGTGVFIQGDLGNALQRPGVVPAMGGDSVQSFQTSGSASAYSIGSDSYDQSMHQRVGGYHQQHTGSFPQHATTGPYQNLDTGYGSAGQAGMNYPRQYVSGDDGGAFRGRSQHFEPVPSSAASSVTMDGQGSFPFSNAPSHLGSMHQQQLGFQNQNQFLPQQQHHQMMYNQQQQFPGMQQGLNQPGMMMMQQQPLVFQQPAGQFQQQQPKQDQHRQQQPSQQQQLIPQQQVTLVQSNEPGGGFYYIVTSATGQPILLQPVGMLNQQQIGQQMPQQQQFGANPNQQFQGQVAMQGPMMAPMQPMQNQYGQQQQHLFMMGHMQPPQQHSFQQQQAQFPQQQHQQPANRSRQSSQQRHSRRPYGGGTSM